MCSEQGEQRRMYMIFGALKQSWMRVRASRALSSLIPDMALTRSSQRAAKALSMALPGEQRRPKR